MSTEPLDDEHYIEFPDGPSFPPTCRNGIVKRIDTGEPTGVMVISCNLSARLPDPLGQLVDGKHRAAKRKADRQSKN